MAPARLLVPILGVLLASCSVTRHSAAPTDAELTGYVLVLEESPGGQVTYDWRQAEEFDLSWYRFPTSARASTYGRIVLAAKTYTRDCDAENDQCIEMCMSRPLPRGFGHIRSGGRGMGGKAKWCREQCRQAYDDCRELESRQR
ncbi:hypothetical protein NR798_05070 [Archangium gephyra]|uniref:hypothetical protein n=1 Tax=Archangium gephyra TaxID=48 RepID=UPI0035D4254A